MNIVGDLHHDDRKGDGEAGHAGEERDGAKESKCTFNKTGLEEKRKLGLRLRFNMINQIKITII